MASPKQLVVASPCRRCGILIPRGMPLDNLTWDLRERSWSHRNPLCEVVEQLVREGMTPGETSSVPGPAAGPPGPSWPGRTGSAGIHRVARSSSTRPRPERLSSHFHSPSLES